MTKLARPATMVGNGFAADDLSTFFCSTSFHGLLISFFSYPLRLGPEPAERASFFPDHFTLSKSLFLTAEVEKCVAAV